MGRKAYIVDHESGGGARFVAWVCGDADQHALGDTPSGALRNLTDPEPDPEGLVCIPRDMARLAADGLEVRADDLHDLGSNAYGAGDEDRGEDIQRRARNYRRVVRALRDRLKEAGDGE